MKLIKQDFTLPEFSAASEALALCVNACAACGEFQMVDNPAGQDAAVAAAKKARELLNAIEDARKVSVAPLLARQREINEIAKTMSQPLQNAVDRISAMVTNYQVAEEQRVRAEEATRAKELARLEAERLAALSAQQKAEANMRTEKQLAKAVAAEEAAKAASEAQAVIVATPGAAVNKARGAATGRELRWEVTDIKALYKARPDLVRPLEVNVAAVKASCRPENPPIPGLKVWWEAKTVIRSR